MQSAIRRNAFVIVMLTILSFSMSGCFWLVVGGAAAAGGYVVTRDTIQGETEQSFDEIWDAAKEIMSVMGAIESESYELGQIKGIVNGSRVTVNVLQLTSSTVRLKVKARKFIFPSIANAQEVYIKVMNRVNEGI